MSNALTGDLKWLRLSTVAQLVELEGFSGYLDVAGVQEVAAFAKGQLIGCQWAGFDGALAFKQLFLVSEAPFTLRPAPVTGTSLGPMMAIVMDACHTSDEWDRLAAEVIEVAEMPPVADVGLRAVLENLDGTRCVAEAVRGAGVGVVAVVHDLSRMVASGALVATGVQRPQSVAVAPEADTDQDHPSGFYDALEASRTCLRNADLDGAEGALRQALALRPGNRMAEHNLRRLLLLRSQRANSARRVS